MKIKNKQMLGLVAALLLACPAVHARRATMRVEVTNSSKMPRTDEPVVFNLKDIGEVKRAIVTLNGKEIPSQLDDLDGDCVYDELCFLTDVGAHETKNYRVELFDDGEQKTFPARTFAELVLPSKDKKLPKISRISICAASLLMLALKILITMYTPMGSALKVN